MTVRGTTLRWCSPACSSLAQVLTGLLTQHEALGTAGALPLALGMAEYVFARAVASRAAHGEAHWAEGLNYEVGALSELYAALARATRNASWLTAAALFDRRCFTGPLALAATLHGTGGGGGGGGGEEVVPALDEPQSEAEAAVADSAFEGMHANAQLAYVLGAAELYLATGEVRARDAAVGFWRQLQRAYAYLTGGSSFQEEWRSPGGASESMVESSLRLRGPRNWQAHDHAESCVTHNAMLLSTKMMRWHAAASRGVPVAATALRSLAALCDWYETALHNGVLGTQRGSQPGAVLYMMPLGGGVSKRGGAKGWSNTEHHFWCCMGSAAEAFGRLHHAVWWASPPPPPPPPPAAAAAATVSLYLLQLVPSAVAWEEAGVELRLQADVPGELPAASPAQPLVATVSVQRLGERRGDAASRVELHVRIPGWAQAAEAAVASVGGAAAPLPPPAAGSFLRVALGVGDSLSLRLRPRLAQRPVRPGSPLRGLFHGPVLLAALTDGDRRLFVGAGPPSAWAVPVPPAARESLVSLRPACACRHAKAGQEGRARGDTPRLVVSHAADRGGKAETAELAREPPPLPTRRGRRGGSDAANAASWRLGASPAGPLAARTYSAREPTVLEPFGRPGVLLSSRIPAPQGTAVVELLPAAEALGGASGGPLQRWWLRPVASVDCPCGADPPAPSEEAARVDGLAAGSFALESADSPGFWVVIGPLPPPPPPPPPGSKQSAPEPRGPPLLLRQLRGSSAAAVPPEAAVLRVSRSMATYPPLSYWAQSNVSACSSPGRSRRATACGDARRTYLMVPLNGVLDEHYSPFLCTLSPGAAVPGWCS